MVTAMKPRQVLLSCASVATNGKPLSVTSDQRPVLLQAVCLFLESNGFSKTLKKFLSEASLEKDSWKNCLVNLEDACCMYLAARSQNDADAKNISSAKEASKEIIDDDASIKPKEKKKKKSEKDSSTQIAEVPLVESEAALVDTSGQEKSSKKSKDKKKKKESKPTTDEPLNGNLQTSCVEKENKESADPEKNSKPKSERKKKKESKVDNADDNVDQDKKSSKKRKKSSSEETEVDDLRVESEDTKCRKTVGSGDEGSDEQVTKATGKQMENGLEDNGGDKSASNKSSAKKDNGSEPTSQKAFQRVKADEVEFADERLQDNSYWAKDGADVGYGAKAQEVLGQVRGRDFRHEKTKKKRGSYRGGMIDLQSHSVKFNYSDSEE